MLSRLDVKFFHISVRIADPDAQSAPCRLDLVSPFFPCLVGDGEDRGWRLDSFSEFVPVLIRNVSKDSVPWPLKLHLNRLLNNERGVFMDGNFRVELLDSEVLSKRRRNKKDEVEAKAEENNENKILDTFHLTFLTWILITKREKE